MPPAPSRARISYAPIRLPGWAVMGVRHYTSESSASLEARRRPQPTQIMRCASFGRFAVSGAAHGQNFAGSRRSADEHAAVLAVLHGAIRDRDLVARSQGRPGPATAGQIVRTHAFERVGIGAALVVGDVDPDPDM